MSFNQFKNKLLSLCADITRIVNTKEFVVCVVVGLMILFFILGFVFKYGEIKSEIEWKHFMKVSQEEAKKEEIESKVKFIMERYGCTDYIILEAILNTKHPVIMSCLIGQESGYNPLVISSKNALGLCQILQCHFKRNEDWRDPVTNIKVADRLLNEYMDYFKNDSDQVSLALASYNAGFPLVQQIKKIPDYQETKKYVKNIKSMMLQQMR